MPGAPSPSFIPKQNPTKAKRASVSRQVYVLTIVGYLSILSVLIASAAVFFYERYSERMLTQKVEQLDLAIADFDKKKMDDVVLLSEQLTTIESLLDKNLSIRTVLRALEQGVIETVKIDSLVVTQESDNQVALQAQLTTDSFDSVIFQRSLFNETGLLGEVSVESVTMALGDDVLNPFERVNLSARFSFDESVIPAQFEAPQVPEPAAASSSEQLPIVTETNI